MESRSGYGAGTEHSITRITLPATPETGSANGARSLVNPLARTHVVDRSPFDAVLPAQEPVDELLLAGC